MKSLPLDSVVGAGVELTYADAVALVQELIASLDAVKAEPDPGITPPAIENLRLDADGLVHCSADCSYPTVTDVAALLDALLSRATSTRVPGGLRYILGRARRDVDAPPFGSLADLSVALSRHEVRPRGEVLRDLFARAAASASAPADVGATPVTPVPAAVSPPPPEDPLKPLPFAPAARKPRSLGAPGPSSSRANRIGLDERRRSPAVAAHLRRQLREADLALYAQRQLREADRAYFARHNQAPKAAVAGAAAVLLAFGAGYAIVHERQPAPHAGSLTTAPSPSVRVVAQAPTLPAKTIMSGSPLTLPDQRRSIYRAAEAMPDAVVAKRASAIMPAVERGVPASAGPVFSPAFASDGTALFFHSGTSADDHTALAAERLNGDDLRVMTIVDDGFKNYHVQPSPDGTRVAFDSDRDGERGVYVANRDGSDVHRVSGPGYAAVPTWSPDATKLAFVRAEERRPRVWNLWLLDIQSGESRRLTSYPYGQTWSASWFPDGRRIAYTHEDRLILRDLSNGSSTQYASPVAGRLARTPAVSPDGRYVIFQVARTGAWLLDLRTGAMKCVLADPTAEEFAWAPDARRIAFHSRRDGQWGVWVMTPAQPAAR